MYMHATKKNLALHKLLSQVKFLLNYYKESLYNIHHISHIFKHNEKKSFKFLISISICSIIGIFDTE